MRIKTYEASTMQEALLLARNELGENAVVLNTKHVKSGGILGFGGAEKVEIMAAIDESQQQTAAPAVKTATAVIDKLVDEEPASFRSTMEVQHPLVKDLPEIHETISPQPVAHQAFPEINRQDAEFDRLQSEVRELSNIVKNLLTSGTSTQPTPGSHPQSLLTRLGVDPDLANTRFADCSTISNPNELAQVLSMRLNPIAQPPVLSGHEVIAIVGPTGVGKTTTLAKLAAYFSLELGKSVAMVTADTFRIGAVEQLRTYARIMGIPIEIALSPEEVAEGVAKHADKDVVLIDTVGRSQRNNEHIDELKDFVQAAAPTQIHLVVAGSSAPQIQDEVVAKFAALSPTHLIVTKLDESPNRGCIINIPFKSGIPISCTTAGQNVPQDIDFATPQGLAKSITEVA